MKIAMIGGVGAMGSTMGALLSKSGNDVSLIDVSREAIEAINTRGLKIDDKSGSTETVKVPGPQKTPPHLEPWIWCRCL